MDVHVKNMVVLLANMVVVLAAGGWAESIGFSCACVWLGVCFLGDCNAHSCSYFVPAYILQARFLFACETYYIYFIFYFGVLGRRSWLSYSALSTGTHHQTETIKILCGSFAPPLRESKLCSALGTTKFFFFIILVFIFRKLLRPQ